MPSANEIIGHKKIISNLKKAIKNNSLASVYLFWGGESVGKRTVAEFLAQAIVCTNPKFAPCRRCPSCLSFETKSHPDVSLIKSERQISIKEIRALLAFVSQTPSIAPSKVALIDDADQMTTEAQNSFLKTLEEPKGQAIFILIAQDLKKLLPTVKSRAQSIRFFPAQKQDLEKIILAHQKGQTKLVSLLANGKLGLAKTMAQDPALLAQKKSALDTFIKVTKLPDWQRLEIARELAEKEESSISQNLDTWLSVLRSLLLSTLASTQNPFAALSLRLGKEKISHLIRDLTKMKSELSRPYNLRARLESFLLKV